MQARIGALLLLPCMAGCSHWRAGTHLDYRTIQADPNHDTERAKAENQRGLDLLDKGKPDKAEQVLQKALIADVTYGPAHNNLGKLYFTQGKFYLAAWEFEYAVKLMPQRAECHNNLGMVYEAVGKFDEAIDSYSVAYGIDGKNPVIIGNLARARIRRGDQDTVVQQLLTDLRLYDTRPAWRRWANERLALAPSPTSSPSPMIKEAERSKEELKEEVLELIPPPPTADPSDTRPHWPRPAERSENGESAS